MVDIMILLDLTSSKLISDIFHHVNVSVLIKFLQKNSVFTVFIISSP